jgi:diguanylate cyclase (GGDEF)-like protein
MTLSKQLVVLICALVILLFAGSFAISVEYTRSYLNTQLASLARDAATTLGFKASDDMAGQDRAMVQVMTDAVFDGGDYSQVRITDMSGEVWVDRQASRELEGVPDWFVRWLPLETPLGEAAIMAGWRQAGVVQVRSNPAFAYQQLWQTARDSLMWFLACALLVMLVGLVTMRLMLRPLKEVEAQAEAICRREFPVVQRRPFTLEFRRVVEAMNRLSSRVKRMLDESEQLADKLRQQAFTDPVTGLANRRRFMDTLAHRVEDREHMGSGVLLLVQLNDFKAYNQQAGYAAGDTLLRRCAEVLQQVVPAGRRGLLAHTAGADFAMLIEQLDQAGARQLAATASRAVAGLYRELSLPSSDVAHVGGALFHGQTASEWLAEADLALRQAQRDGANAVQLLASEAAGGHAHGAAEWRRLLEQVLESGAWELARQPVFATADRSVLHEELFLRIPDPDRPGEQLSAGQFLPMAESVGLSANLDRAVLSRVMDEIDAGRHACRQAINLSPASLRDADFVAWLQAEMAARPVVAGQLIVEFPEYGASLAEGLGELVAALETLGVEVALDHFGSGFSSLAQVRALKAHYLKLDGSLVRSLESDSDARFFVQALTKIAHGLEMQVVADSVENAAVWDLLQELGVDGGRGYWLARPQVAP